MVSLADIEAVIDKLSPAEKQELLLFLAARLRAENGHLPKPRQYTSEQLKAWIAEDEADMRRFSDSEPK